MRINTTTIKVALKKARLASSSVFMTIGLVATMPVYALPQLNSVASGSIKLTQSAHTTVIKQSSQKAILNWNSFNIGVNEKAQFIQPGRSAVALNRISAQQGASQIAGKLSSNGIIILINGAGIHFAGSAAINVGGLIASTADIANSNFLRGKYIFDQASQSGGSISNDGHIIAASHGLVALMGNNVTNTGVISAELGSIALGSGDTFTLDFNGDQLINFTVSKAASQGGQVKNSGKLLADGGRILVTARAAANVLDDAIDMDGVAQANSVQQKGGEIILSADTGTVVVKGKVMALGQRKNTKGGIIRVLGSNVKVNSSAVIDVSGQSGGGTLLVGGSPNGRGPLPDAETTTVAYGAVLNASALTQGDGGTVTVWGTNSTVFNGSLFARGGLMGGNGGNVETSGHYLDVSGAHVDLSAPHGITGNWLLDPFDVTISTGADTNNSYFDGSSPTNTYTPLTQPSNINTTTLSNNLSTANVTITTNSSNPAANPGNITVSNPISWSSSNTLTLQASNNIIISAGISGTNGGLVLSAPGIIEINTASTIATGSGGQTYTGAVQLNANTTLTSGTGNIQFTSTLDSFSATARTLTLTTSGIQTFSGAIGNTHLLSTLSTGTGSTALNGGTIKTSGAGGQVYNGAVTLGADTTLTLTGAGIVNFISTVNSAVSTSHSLSISTTGIETFGGLVGNTNALTSLATGTGSIVINGGNGSGSTNTITTSGSAGQVYNGAVTLGANTNLSANTGVISFVSTLNSVGATAFSLSSATSGTETFTGAVGGTHALASLSTGTGTTAIAAAITLTTNGSNGQTYNGAVTLAGNTVFAAGAGNITFTSTLDSSNTTARTVSLTTSGTQTFGGLLGSINALSSVSTGTGNIAINGGDGTGTTNTITTTGTNGLVFSGAVLLGADTILSTGTRVINFTSTVDSASTTPFNLTLNTSGAQTFTGLVGGVNALASLTTGTGTTALNGGNGTGSTSTVTTSGVTGQVYNGAVTLGANTILSASAGPIDFVSTLNSVSTTAFNLSAVTSGTETFTGAVGSSHALASLSTGTGTIAVAAAITLTTNGATGQTYNGAVTLAGNTTFAAGTGSVNFTSTLDSSNATSRSATITTSGIQTFSDLIGNTNPLLSFTTGTGIVNINGGDGGGGTATITTNGAGGQVYNGNVRLGADTLLTAGTGAINFTKTLDSVGATAYSLTTSTSGTGTFSGNVGGNNPLFSLATGTGTTAIGAAITLTTNGSTGQVYNGAVTLAGNTSFVAGTGAINFTSTLNSSSATARAATLTTSGLQTFAGLIGNTHALSTLTTGTGNIAMNGGQISTSGSGGQTYNGAVTLGADTTLTLAGAGTLNFTSTLDSQISTTHSLAITTTGAQTFNDLIGNTDALTSLTTGTGAVILNGGNGTGTTNTVTTTGITGQIYNGAVTLGANTNLSASTAPISFISTLNSAGVTAFSLNASTSGTETFTGAVGGTHPLSSLSTGTGTTAIAAAITLTTNGASGQTYHGAVTVAGTTTFSAGSGPINFTSTLDSSNATARSITLSTSGTQTLSGLIGSINVLSSFTTGTGPVQINGGNGTGSTNTISVNGTNGMVFNGAVILGANTNLSAGTRLINFTSTIDSASTTPFSLLLSTSGAQTFSDLIGNTNALSSLTTGTGAAAINGGNGTGSTHTITTTGATGEVYNGAITLGANTLLSASNGPITFASTINSVGATAFSLSIETIGTETFTGAVGGTHALLSLTTGTGNVALAAAMTLTTNGAAGQTYNGAVSLAGNTTFAAGTGAINFASTLDSSSATARSVTLTSSGIQTFNGFVGNTNPLLSLSTGTGSVFINGGDSNGTVSTLTTSGGSQTFNGVVTLGDNTLLSAGSSFVAFTKNIIGNGHLLIINATGNSSITGVFSDGTGTSSLTLAAAGRLTLSGANTYSGATTIAAGTLQLASSGSVPSGSALILDSGTQFNLANISDSIGSLSGSGNINLGTSNATTLTVGNDNTNTTYTGSISGSGGLTKVGTGNLTLANANFYTRATNIQFGTLTAGVAGAIPSTSTLNIASTGTLGLGFDLTVTGLTGAGNINIDSGVTLTVNDSANFSYSGALTGAGNFTKQGSGTQTLAGLNNYSGTTQIQHGILTISGNSTLGATIVTGTGAELKISDAIVTVSSLSLSGSGVGSVGAVVGSGSATLNGNIILTADTTLGTTLAGDVFTVKGAIDGSSNLSLTGPGTLVLSGSIGETSPLTSLTTNVGSAFLLGDSVVNTVQDQVYHNAIQLTFDVSMTSSTGNLNFNDSIDGAFRLTLNSAGIITFNNTVGSTTPLASLSVTAGGTQMNTGLVTTSGAQSYNSPLTLNVSTVMTGSTITLNQGVTGSSLTLNGTSGGDNTFSLASNVTVPVININANLTGNNTLALSSNSDQSWSINGVNAGLVSFGNTTLNFNHIANLAGGSGNDTFNMSGGNLSGSLDGGAGRNALVATSQPVSVVVNAPYSGYVQGFSAFTNIHNLVGLGASSLFVATDNHPNTITFNGPGSGVVNNTLGFSEFTHFINTSSNLTVIFNLYGVYNYLLNTVAVNNTTLYFKNQTRYIFNNGFQVINTGPVKNAIVRSTTYQGPSQYPWQALAALNSANDNGPLAGCDTQNYCIDESSYDRYIYSRSITVYLPKDESGTARI